ncbi:MAG: ribonuclease H-like domain-containing protein [Anaerolineales bacterium]
MPSLSDRLKALGLQIGVSDPALKPPREEHPIESVVGGRPQHTEFGEAFLVERFLPADELHGALPLRFPPALDKLAAWAADSRLALLPPERFLFLDTETTGVWGSGTMAFLVGMGRFEPGGFRQTQYFLREPIEERAMLEALNHLIGRDDALVTFNGKSFDLPLLKSRYLTNGAPHPFVSLPHIDLLHLARRLWRDLLPSRALGDLEVSLLGVLRTQQDIPGWMIPQMYIDFLHTGDARPLASVFYHNSMDVLSMASLLEHLAAKLAAPLDIVEHHSELYAIGRLYADTGFAEEAIGVFQSTLSMELPADTRYRLVANLAVLFRRRGDYEAALQLWEQAAADGHVYAYVEIAKYYEHRTGDCTIALQYTQRAIKLVDKKKTPDLDRQYWQPLLVHRLARLERKLSHRAV